MFIIVMLCNDDGDYYVDHITRPFISKPEAERAIERAIKDEIDGLTDYGEHDTDIYTVKDGNEVQKNGVLLTKYEILGIEDTCIKDNLVSHLMRINPDYDNEKLLQNAIYYFEDYFGIENRDWNECICGSITLLNKIIGKDYRDSDLLIQIVKEFECYFDPELDITYEAWKSAIKNVVGQDKINEIFEGR